LHRGDVQKHIRTAGVILDETEAAIGIPHFQGSGSHRALFPLRLRQIDAVLAKFGRALGEAAAALRSFFRECRWVDYLFDRLRGELLSA
jgi:hypothetical protein